MSKSPTHHATPGCYIDSHLGHYAIVESIKLAISFGMPIDPFADFTISKYDDCYFESEYPSEAIHELADDAEAYLNDHITVDGYAWGWNDGDFGLYSLTEDERVEEADDEHEVCPDCGNTGTKIGERGYQPCIRYLSCWSDGE